MISGILILLFLAIVLFGVWSVLASPFSKAKRKARLRNFGLCIPAAFVALIAVGMAGDTEDAGDSAMPVVDSEATQQTPDIVPEPVEKVKEEPPADASVADAPPEEKAPTIDADAECRQDLACWGDKALSYADAYCDDHIERLAQYDVEWTDGWLGLKFSHYRWADQDAGIITMIGDKAKFQNGFGAWQNVIYECDYDPSEEAVLEVRAEPGRL